MGKTGKLMTRRITMMMHMLVMMMMTVTITYAADTNSVFDPCSDSKVQKSDGFTFGLAFSSRDSFFSDQVQLSPCDNRLSLASKRAQLAVFRPKVDEISLLTVNTSSFNPVTSGSGGYMVAFAGRKYAARSIPTMIADNSHTITNFTLVLEFKEGVLQSLYWKSFGCNSCSGDYVCRDNKECAIPNSKCSYSGGPADCNLGIQLTFSGTDKNLQALNTWYEVQNLRKYSLYGLFDNIRDTVTG